MAKETWHIEWTSQQGLSIRDYASTALISILSHPSVEGRSARGKTAWPSMLELLARGYLHLVFKVV